MFLKTRFSWEMGETIDEGVVKWLADQMEVRIRGGMSGGVDLAGCLLEKDREADRKWKLLEKIR